MKIKKGVDIGMEWILVLLIAFAVILVLAPVVKELGGYVSAKGSSVACAVSLRGRESPECPIGKVKILSGKVEINGKKFMEREKMSTQDMAKEALANLLVSCFNRGGGSNSDAFKGGYFYSDESVCVICYKLTIADDVGEIADFTGYLRDTKAKIFSDKKYLEFLTKDDESLEAYMTFGMEKDFSPSAGTFIFKPNQEYSIFFMGLKKGYIPKLGQKIKNAVTLNFLELFFGKQDTYYAYIAETNKLSTCQRIVN